jgi:hypothetical protein
VTSKARRFKSVHNGGAGQEEKDQDGLSSGPRELEWPPVIERWLKLSPDRMFRANISISRTSSMRFSRPGILAQTQIRVDGQRMKRF